MIQPNESPWGWPNTWHYRHGCGHAKTGNELPHQSKQTIHHREHFLVWSKSSKSCQVAHASRMKANCLIFLYTLCKLTCSLVSSLAVFSFTICFKASENWAEVVSMQQDQEIWRVGPLCRAQNHHLRVANLDAHHLLPFDLLLSRGLAITWCKLLIPFLLQLS